jgi:Carboxypeptidase regulatory-like domain/TonB dependent receptor-like, beta-barrel
MKGIAALAVVLGLLASAPTESRAQNSAGGMISGHIHGPGGVSVPGATVVLVNPQTGERKATWSDESGDYTFSNVPPGTYKLQTSLVGFRDDAREPIPIAAGKTLRVNVSLVMAFGNAPESNGATNPNPSGGAAFNPESLPPQVRERLQSMGSQGGGTNGESTEGVTNVRFSGGGGGAAQPPGDTPGGEGAPDSPDLQASASNSFLLSGSVAQAVTPGDDREQMRRRFEEFRRARQSQSAPGFGGGGFEGGGGFFMMGGRWGGRRPQINRIRGNVFERYSNSALDAHPYPLNVATSPQIPSYSEQAGIGMGGPLTIPGIYHGKDKTSFFFNYSLGRNRNPFDSFATVPTMDERNGDFSKTVIASGPLAGTTPILYNPLSNASGPRTPFQGNVIPSSMFSAATVGLLPYIPLPNLPGSVQNFHLQEALPNSSDRVMGRVGHEISDKDNVGVFYFLNSSRSKSVSNYPVLTRTNSTRSQNVNVNESHTFSPHLINNFVVNFNRQRISTLNPFAFKQNVAGDLGIQGISQDPRDWGLPLISFTNFTGLNDLIPSLTRNQTWRAVDFVILNAGKHNLRFGGELRRVQMNALQDPNARGTFTFSGFTTSDLTASGLPANGTGFDFADFLLGLPQVTTVRFGTSSNYFRSWVYSGFVQDDWRASSHLTLNIGARYEYFQPLTEKYGHLSDLAVSPDFSSAAVVTAQSPGSLPESLIRPDKNNWSPRVGIAYRPWTQRRLVLRAGYGIFYDQSIYQRLTPNLANQPPFAQASTLTTSPQQVLTLENGFPVVDPTVARNTYAVDPNFRTPYGQSWNFSLEDEIMRDWILSLGYVGTKGSKLDLLLGPNLATSGTSLDTQGQLSLKNAQQFTYETSGATSIYQGLNLELRRQYHNGLSLDAEYTFSKSIDDAASIGVAGHTVAQNWQDLRAERGLSSFDVRHRFTLRHSYELPFGDRKRFLNHGGAMAGVLGDWRISGNATIQTGTPFTARVLGNLSAGAGTGAYQALRADATGAPVSLPASQRTTLEYFNTAAFTQPLAGELGNAGRNTIPGPGRVVFNMSLGRFLTFSREKNIGADIRVDANNIFNTPTFNGLATVVNATDFGRVTSVGSMRTLNFSMRLRF